MMRALLAAAALLCAGTGAAAVDAWRPAAPPAGGFTVLTPCSTDEIAAAQAVPSASMNLSELPEQARVVCRKGKLLFLAGTVSVPALPAGASNLFDLSVHEAGADRTAEGTPRVTSLGGRRAFLNRQREGDTLAQTGFVEVDRTSIVLLVTGIEPGSGLSPAEQDGMVDRFFASLHVGAR